MLRAILRLWAWKRPHPQWFAVGMISNSALRALFMSSFAYSWFLSFLFLTATNIPVSTIISIGLGVQILVYLL